MDWFIRSFITCSGVLSFTHASTHPLNTQLSLALSQFDHLICMACSCLQPSHCAYAHVQRTWHSDDYTPAAVAEAVAVWLLALVRRFAAPPACLGSPSGQSGGTQTQPEPPQAWHPAQLSPAPWLTAALSASAYNGLRSVTISTCKHNTDAPQVCPRDRVLTWYRASV